MSVLEAAKPLRRRALERQGMTEEVELQLLIQEQETDDVYFVSQRPKEVSFDRTAHVYSAHNSGLGGGLVSDFIGVSEEGELLSFLPRLYDDPVFALSFKHSTFDAYNNKGCRCRQCKTFMAEYRRQKRAA